MVELSLALAKRTLMLFRVSGFLLAEASLGLFLLVFSTTLFVSLFNAIALRQSHLKKNIQAIMLARSFIEEYRSERGTRKFVKDGFSVTVAAQKHTELGSYTSLTVTVRWKINGQDVSFVLKSGSAKA
jgi:hypothetical protein